MEWGGIVVDKKADFGTELNAYISDKMVEDVKVVRLAEFILEVVKKRRLPESAKTTPPQVIMKLDIEGKELEVLPDLLMSGALVSVDRMFLEWHGHHTYVSANDTALIQDLIDAACWVAEEKQLVQRCHIQDLDDETYMEFTG